MVRTAYCKDSMMKVSNGFILYRTRFSILRSSSHLRSGVIWRPSRSRPRRHLQHYKVNHFQMNTHSPRDRILMDFHAGQIAASLASLSRTVDDYSALSKKELIPAKQEKAFERVKNFRTELGDYRQQFDSLRKAREDAVSLFLLVLHCYYR